MTNIFGLHSLPCETARYTIKLMPMCGGEEKEKEPRAEVGLLEDSFSTFYDGERLVC